MQDDAEEFSVLTPVSRRKLVGAVSLAAASAAGVAEAAAPNTTGTAHLRYLRPQTMRQTSYSHVVEVTGPGRLIYTAGEQGGDINKNIPKDFEAQAVQAFENLKSALAAVGANFDHVVKMNTYMIDLKAHTTILGRVRARYLNQANPPASTTVQVPALTNDGALIEIDVVAALPA